MRENIHHWLKSHPPVTLNSGEGGEKCVKAGLLPFLGVPRRYLLMLPKASRPELGPPDWQVAKGTRMACFPEGWRDVRKPPSGMECEAPAVTALREGVEEIGIKLENLFALYDLGEFSFNSARGGGKKTLRLFAAEMQKAEDFLPMETIAAATQGREWRSLEEWRSRARPDHARIVEKADKLLKNIS